MQDNKTHDSLRAIQWQDDHLLLLDQRILPAQSQMRAYDNISEVGKAITDMVVRGAPAIGVTAAYGVVLAAQAHFKKDANNWRETIQPDLDELAKARPTAINLFWAIERMKQVFNSAGGNNPVPLLLEEAQKIHAEDIAANHKMGELGSGLIEKECGVITHCNAGALATGGYGTALGVIRAGYANSKISMVYADETRPWLQGARLTAWEMVQENIPVTLLTDGAAANLMKQGKVGWAIVGSDRIAANGDVANKIGTYSLAVAAKHHGVKFMVVAPTSTVDMNAENGDAIPIELRSEDEVLRCTGNAIAPDGAKAWNPAFDVTPAELVDAIVTERGVVTAPNAEKMSKMMSD